MEKSFKFLNLDGGWIQLRIKRPAIFPWKELGQIEKRLYRLFQHFTVTLDMWHDVEVTFFVLFRELFLPLSNQIEKQLCFHDAVISCHQQNEQAEREKINLWIPPLNTFQIFNRMILILLVIQYLIQALSFLTILATLIQMNQGIGAEDLRID